MKLIPLDEAAEMLGIPPEKLLDMRSRNDIFGYRDGSTWKFKQAELDRVASSLGVSMTEAAPDGDSGVDLDLASETGSDANILVDVDDDLDEMISVEDSGLLDVKEVKPDTNDDVLELGAADDEVVLADSDIELVLDDSGIDLELEDDGDAKVAATEESDIELSLEDSDIPLAGTDSDAAVVVDAGSDLDLAGDSGPELSLEDSGPELSLEDSGPELSLEDSGPELTLENPADEAAATIVGSAESVTDEVAAAAGGSDFDFDLSDVDLSDDSDVGKGAAAAGIAAAGAAAAAAVGAVTGKSDEDELQLDMDGSDISLGESSDLELSMDDSSIELDLDGDASSSSIKLDESGINLTSPSDSGLSLETPELGAGSDVDALELGEADDVIDIGDEAVDLEEATVMAVDNDFLLEPVESDIDDIDSGSQIIALDTEEIDPGSDSVLDEGVLDEGAFVEATDELDPGLASLPDEGGVAEVAPLGAAAASSATLAPEIPYSVWNIVGLSLCTLLMAIGGLMMSDVVMNMWSWDGPYSLNSQLMDSVLGIFGM